MLTLIDNDGVDPVSGTFAGLNEGAIVTLNASDFQISYVGGDGNDVTLTVVAAAKTWTGTVNGLWSVPGNWQGGVPGAGDPLVFPFGASNLTNTNDLPSATVYKLMLFTGSNYVINGNTIGLQQRHPAEQRLLQPHQRRSPVHGATDAGRRLLLRRAHARQRRHRQQRGDDRRRDGERVISGTGPVTMGDVTVFAGNNTYGNLTTVSGAGRSTATSPGATSGQRHAERRRHGRQRERQQHAESRRRLRRRARQAHHRQPRLRQQHLLHRAAQRTHRRHRLRPGRRQRHPCQIDPNVYLNLSLGYSPSNGQSADPDRQRRRRPGGRHLHRSQRGRDHHPQRERFPDQLRRRRRQRRHADRGGRGQDLDRHGQRPVVGARQLAGRGPGRGRSAGVPVRRVEPDQHQRSPAGDGLQADAVHRQQLRHQRQHHPAERRHPAEQRLLQPHQRRSPVHGAPDAGRSLLLLRAHAR